MFTLIYGYKIPEPYKVKYKKSALYDTVEVYVESSKVIILMIRVPVVVEHTHLGPAPLFLN
jgi:hypothetical protein